MALNFAAAVNGRAHKWWVGQDGNIWANIAGLGVQNLGSYSGANKSVAQGDWLNRIDDPNPGNSQAANKSGAINYGGSGSTSYSRGSSSSYDAEEAQRKAEEEAKKQQMRNIYDQQIGDINHNLSSLQGQLDNSLAGVKGEYEQYKNEQQSSYDAEKNLNDTKTLQNRQNLVSNRNDITSRASRGLRSLLRVLGAMGAGGGSEALYLAPSIVTKQANREYSNAGNVYRENQQNIDTNWGNYQNQFDNDRKKLEDWYNGQVKAKKQENYEKGQSLLADLATAYGNRAQYGGDYSNNINDVYNRIKDYRNKINDLGKYTQPKYTGVTAVYKSPDLASYNTGNTDLTTSVTNSSDGTSPLLVALQGLNKKKSNSPYTNVVEG